MLARPAAIAFLLLVTSTCLRSQAPVRVELQIGHRGPVGAVAVSPGGEMVASGGADGKTRLWESGTGKLLRVLPPPHNRVISLAFTRDGSHLVIGQINGVSMSWDVARDAPAHVHEFGSGGYCGAAVSPDGRLMAVGCDGKLAILEVAGGRVVREIIGPRRDRFWSLAFSPDGRHLASASDEIAGYVWRVSDGKAVRELHAEEQYSELAFGHDGMSLHARSQSGRITSWDLASDAAPETTEEEPEVVRLAVDRQGAMVCVLGSGVVLRRDDASKRTLAGPLDDPTTTGVAAGELVITGHRSGKVLIRSAGKGKLLSTPTGASSTPILVGCTPAGTIRVAVFAVDSVSIVELGGEDETEITWQSPELVERASFALSPDARHLAWGFVGKPVEIVDLASGKAVPFPDSPAATNVLAISTGGRFLARRVTETSVTLHDRSGETPTRELPGKRYNDILGLAFSPDGRHLAQGGKGNFIRVLDLVDDSGTRTYEPARDARPERHDQLIGWVRSFAFGGDHLLCGGPYSTTVLRDRVTLKSVRAWHEHDGSVRSVAFTAGGQRVVSAGGGGRLFIRGLDEGPPLATVHFFGNADWIAVDAKGRYQATPGAGVHAHGVLRTDDGAWDAVDLPAGLRAPTLLQGTLKTGK